VAQQLQVDGHGVQRRLDLVHQGAGGDRDALHRRGEPVAAALLHHQPVDQIEAGADFVAAAVVRARQVGAGLRFAQRVVDEAKTPGIERGGQKSREQRHVGAEQEQQGKLPPQPGDEPGPVRRVDP